MYVVIDRQQADTLSIDTIQYSSSSGSNYIVMQYIHAYTYMEDPAILPTYIHTYIH